jgi:hypothetical protein
MNVPCKVSAAEMREAYRLNLTAAFWWRAALGNFRTLIYLGVLVVLVGAKISGDSSIQWSGIAVIFSIVVLFFGLYLFRLHRNIMKTARQLYESCTALQIDGQGITADSTNGSRTFTPWSAISLVFTIGDAKAFRTVPKSALGEMQSAELRSLLLSQIREPVS